MGNIFEKEKFAQLLQKAMGERSINQYALHSGVSATYISKLLRQLVKNPPMPPTIQKLADKGYHVSYEDFMEAAGHVTEPSSIDLIDVLEDKSAELLAAGQPLTPEQRLGVIRVLDNPNALKTKTIPKLGQIRMGVPLLSDGNYEGDLEIPSDILADFALDARGDSMIGVGLLDGDYALCRESKTARNGDIVVGIHRTSSETSEATLKFYFKDGNRTVLRAANPNFEDIVIDEDWYIGGVLVAILRQSAPTYKVYNSYLAARDINEEKWDPVFEKASQLGIKPGQVEALLDMIYQTAKR